MTRKVFRRSENINENETCAKHATMQLSAINTVCSSIVRPLVYNGNAGKRRIIIFFLLQMLMPVYQKTNECLVQMPVNDALVQTNFGWGKKVIAQGLNVS